MSSPLAWSIRQRWAIAVRASDELARARAVAMAARRRVGAVRAERHGADLADVDPVREARCATRRSVRVSMKATRLPASGTERICPSGESPIWIEGNSGSE
jgi:hypothetical protein